MTTEDLPVGRTGPLAPELLLRETEEELGVEAQDVAVRCLGIFEELGDETDANPALFSVLTTELDRETVSRRWRGAPDADEFAELVWVPLDGRVVEQVLSRAESNGSLPVVIESQLDDAVSEYSLTPKTAMMLYLVGSNLLDVPLEDAVERVVTGK